MQVSITGRHVEITAAIKNNVLAKLDHLEGLFPRVKKAQVVLSVEKYRHTAEIHYHADATEFIAKKTTKDMYASIDGVVKALQHQAHKRKDKLRSQKSKRVGAAKAQGRLRADSQDDADTGLATQRPARLPRIVRLKSASKPMREEEAAMALAESGKDFLVYEDARSGRNHVMFKREDGAFGLIEA
jgi:putative sigma-54 modulation protein